MERNPQSGVGRITTPVPGERELELFANVFDAAFLHVSPTLLLDGYMILGGDMVVSAMGSAKTARTTAGWRIDGSIESLGPIRLSWAFTMNRPDDGTPRALGGAWLLDLRFFGEQLHGTLPLTIEVATDGTATTQATRVENAPPGLAYELDSGQCLIAASGELTCSMLVTGPSSGPFLGVLQLHGKLDRAANDGKGKFFAGLIPGPVVQGEWSATAF